MSYIMSEEEKRYLEQYDIRQYDQPSVTVDIAVFAVMTEPDPEDGLDYRKDPPLKLSLLLIRRGNYPYRDCWALPGGFLKPGETLEDCAARELKEETSVTDAFLRPFATFSDTGRDPRGWIISNGFLALVDADDYHLRGGTDAWDARWFRIDVAVNGREKNVEGTHALIRTEYRISLENKELDICLTATVEEEKRFEQHHEKVCRRVVSENGFAFDHAGIILQAFLELQRRTEKDGKIVFDLMPECFTLYHLQEVEELILGKELITPNFRRKIAPLVSDTGKMVSGAGHRPAKLFRRNLESFYQDP